LIGHSASHIRVHPSTEYGHERCHLESGQGLPHDERDAALHGSDAVKGKKPTNIAASVRERLSQAAKRDGEDFQ
jgi:hypothetical protein